MNNDPASDEELALQMKSGSRDALALLAGRYHGPLLGFLFRMTGGDRPLAEDLVQETFLRVLRAIAGYRHPHPFKPWLYAIAVNLVRDHFKQAEMRRVRAWPEDFEATSLESTEDPLLATEDARRVAAAVRSLPLRQRETLILRYYQGLSLAEIAGALRIPEGTVKSRLSLGLQRLKDCLKEMDGS